MHQTKRLLLNKLTLNDHAFIKELVNTEGWLKFIRDRNIKTEDDSKAYIQKIVDNPNVVYWVARLKDEQTPIGVVTFIKRDYLDHHDIGFAFLPQHNNKGYAYEATAMVLREIIKVPSHTFILATTLKENTNSIKLLEKLGLRFDREITNNNETLSVYAASVELLSLKN